MIYSAVKHLVRLYYQIYTPSLTVLTSIFTARIHEQEVTEASHAFKEVNNSPADHQHQWAAHLSLLKEDKIDFFFCMTYFHQLYQHVNTDIMTLEMLINSDNSEAAA